jgi:hypothetical protein
MGEEFEKTTKELLQGVKGPTAKAITIMAINVDNKLDEILAAIKANKAATDQQIEALKTETDAKFSKLKVVMFFSEHAYWLWIIVIAIVIVLGFNSEKVLSITKFLK